MDPGLQDLLIGAVPKHLPFRFESIRSVHWHIDSEGVDDFAVDRNGMRVRRPGAMGSRPTKGRRDIEGDQSVFRDVERSPYRQGARYCGAESQKEDNRGRIVNSTTCSFDDFGGTR